MNGVLIDTSIWIEFFSKQPNISIETISSLKDIIVNGEALIIEPIRAELLSGHIVPRLKSDIILTLDELDMIDLDWNSRTVWDDIISLADVAKSMGLPILGIVDRMILIAALNANAHIASRDRALVSLAREANIKIWL